MKYKNDAVLNRPLSGKPQFEKIHLQCILHKRQKYHGLLVKVYSCQQLLQLQLLKAKPDWYEHLRFQKGDR